MILPISKSFHCLKARIDCLSVANFDVPYIYFNKRNFNGEDYNYDESFRMNDLLDMFDRNLLKMREFKIKQRLAIAEIHSTNNNKQRSSDKNANIPNTTKN